MGSNAVLLTQTGSTPFVPAPREYCGNMCGVHVPGLPPVYGSGDDPTLVMSWFVDYRYTLEQRDQIRAVWRAHGYLDVLLSWPDSRAIGMSAADFGALMQEYLRAGFRPAVMLCSKVYDPPDVPGILANIQPVLPYLVGITPRMCVGWELSLWLSPTQVQELIDALCPLFTPAGTKCYVHFQQGYFAFQQDGHTTADFWNLQVGKLTGIFFQRDLNESTETFLERVSDDCLPRFAGGYGFVSDSGFGHPFDFIGLELSAQDQFNGDWTTQQGDALGASMLALPPVTGPTGFTVRVMGSGNGQ